MTIVSDPCSVAMIKVTRHLNFDQAYIYIKPFEFLFVTCAIIKGDQKRFTVGERLCYYYTKTFGNQLVNFVL